MTKWLLILTCIILALGWQAAIADVTTLGNDKFDSIVIGGAMIINTNTHRITLAKGVSTDDAAKAVIKALDLAPCVPTAPKEK